MNRNIALDLLKITLSFMVVGLHADFLKDINPAASYLTVNGIFRIAVPIFFLISGYYYKNILSNGKLGWWIKRLVFIYLFWMIFYSYFWFKPTDVSFFEFVKIMHILITGYHHLWYLPGLIGAALLLKFTHEQNTGTLVLLIFLLFITGVLIQYIGNYHLLHNSLLDKLFNYRWFHRNFIFLAFPLFSIGYLIKKYDIPEKVSLGVIISATLIGLTLLLLEAYFNYISPIHNGDFDNYLSLILACPSVFLLFLKSDFQGSNKNMALISTGVYFIHPLIMIVTNNAAEIDPTELTVISFSLSIICSYVLIKFNFKTKYILQSRKYK